jgi:hypothetical protein
MEADVSLVAARTRAIYDKYGERGLKTGVPEGDAGECPRSPAVMQ